MEYVKNETGVIQGGENDNELFIWNYKWKDANSVIHYSYEDIQKVLDDIEADNLGPDEEVPLADAPKTGDSSMAYTVFMLLSVLCLVVVNFPTKPAKRRQRRSFPMN